MLAEPKFLPLETCYLFNRGLILLHGISGGIIVLSCYTIAGALIYFAGRRKLRFQTAFLAFTLFMVACGTSQLVMISTLWLPYHWLAGGVKAATAAISLFTAVTTVLMIPRAVALPGSIALQELNERLRREVLERQQAEQQLLLSREALVRQERMRLTGQLASGLAHDLNNTLNVAKLRLTSLRREPSMARHATRLEAIDRAIDEAATTVTRVQELGRTRGGEAELVRVDELLTEAAALSRNTVKARSSLAGQPVEIEWRAAAGVPAIRASRADLEQVLLTLVLNAADAMDKRGKITVEAASQEKLVVVRVCDEGRGIPPNQLERIFEPFFTTKASFGAGLGLSIAREIVESVGGSITATNRDKGGAAFILRFPAATALADGPSADAELRNELLLSTS